MDAHPDALVRLAEGGFESHAEPIHVAEFGAGRKSEFQCLGCVRAEAEDFRPDLMVAIVLNQGQSDTDRIVVAARHFDADQGAS